MIKVIRSTNWDSLPNYCRQRTHLKRRCTHLRNAALYGWCEPLRLAREGHDFHNNSGKNELRREEVSSRTETDGRVVSKSIFYCCFSFLNEFEVNLIPNVSRLVTWLWKKSRKCWTKREADSYYYANTRVHGVYRVIKIIQARLSHRAIENEAAVAEMKMRPFRLGTEIMTGSRKVWWCYIATLKLPN